MKGALIVNGMMILFLLAGCGIFEPPTATPTPTPFIPQNQAVEEVVAFMLEDIADDSWDHTVTIGEPWLDAPSEAYLITYNPVTKNENNLCFYPYCFDYDMPIKVWWYIPGVAHMIEAEDKEVADEEYKHLYMDNIDSEDWNILILDFGIVSVSGNGYDAEVYYTRYCGPTCGSGYIYVLHRAQDGEWKIVRKEHKWQS